MYGNNVTVTELTRDKLQQQQATEHNSHRDERSTIAA
jgi:hypothetical protein